MSTNINYQPIYSINVSDNVNYTDKNNQLDSSGKINEKLFKSKTNYIVEETLNEEPEASSISPDVIFIDKENNNYDLKVKISELNNNEISYHYEIIDNLGTAVFVKSVSKIYILTVINNINNITSYHWEDYNQVWKDYIEYNKPGLKEYTNNTLKGEIFNSYSGENKNTASGEYSHAEGNKTSASGFVSHAGGYYTNANKDYMTAIGKYNVNDSSLNNGKLFAVGNGTADNARSDAFVVKDDGSAYIQTKLNVNSKDIIVQDSSDNTKTNLTNINSLTVTSGTISSAPSNSNDIVNKKYVDDNVIIDDSVIKYKLCDDNFMPWTLYNSDIPTCSVSDEYNNTYVSYPMYGGVSDLGLITKQKLYKIDEQNNVSLLYTIEDCSSFCIIDMVYKNNKLYCIINNDINNSSGTDLHTHYLLKYFDIEEQQFSNEINFNVNDTKLYPYSLTSKSINDDFIFIGTINSTYFISYNVNTTDKTYYNFNVSNDFNDTYAVNQILITGNNNVYLILHEYDSYVKPNFLYFASCTNLSNVNPSYSKIDLSTMTNISNLLNYDSNNTKIYCGATNNDNDKLLIGLYNASGFLLYDPSTNIEIYNFTTSASSNYYALDLQFDEDFKYTYDIKYIKYNNNYYCIFNLNNGTLRYFKDSLIICTPLLINGRNYAYYSYIISQDFNILYIYDINNLLVMFNNKSDLSKRNVSTLDTIYKYIHKIKFNDDINIKCSKEIYLNGKVFCSDLYSYNLHLLNSSVLNSNKTIIHNAPIKDNIENYIIGNPVFLCEDNSIYKLKYKSQDNNETNNKSLTILKNNKIQSYKMNSYNKTNVYTYELLLNKNYLENSCDQVPKVSYENNGKFIGIIVKVIPKDTVYSLRDTLNSNIIIDVDTVDFATHGDYIFKVKSNVEHQTTSGELRKYQIGDEIMYDGTIIDPEQPLLKKYENNSVGVITYIPEDNTDYVSVFKK